MSNRQTDNSFLGDKIALRLSMIPKKEMLNVLDAFHGNGTIWKNIEKQYHGKINITKIDKEQKDDFFTLIGDNVKFLSSLPLQNYDVVDLDAYGIPYNQMKIIFERKFKGIVFVTFIQSVIGRLPYEFLYDLGYTKTMIGKCPTLFCKDGIAKMYRWLAMHGISRVMVRNSQRKSYFGFEIK